MEPHLRFEILDRSPPAILPPSIARANRELGREVAIKQIHQQFLQDPRQLDRYWQEAQLLASLEHPNIVTIYDIVRDRGLADPGIDAGQPAGSCRRAGRSTWTTLRMALAYASATPCSSCTPTASSTATSSPATCWSTAAAA